MFFYDTNIILDSIYSDRFNFENVKHLTNLILEKEVDIKTDVNSLVNMNYTMRKDIDLIKNIKRAFDFFTIIDSTKISIQKAIEFAEKSEFKDIEDLQKIYDAESYDEVVFFITQDKKLLQNKEHFEIQILSIDEIFNKFGYSKNLLNIYVKNITETEKKEKIEEAKRKIEEAEQNYKNVIDGVSRLVP